MSTPKYQIGQEVKTTTGFSYSYEYEGERFSGEVVIGKPCTITSHQLGEEENPVHYYGLSCFAHSELRVDERILVPAETDLEAGIRRGDGALEQVQINNLSGSLADHGILTANYNAGSYPQDSFGITPAPSMNEAHSLPQFGHIVRSGYPDTALPRPLRRFCRLTHNKMLQDSEDGITWQDVIALPAGSQLFLPPAL